MYLNSAIFIANLLQIVCDAKRTTNLAVIPPSTIR